MYRPFGGGPKPFEQVPVMLTRLQVRYSAATFPEDLTFQETQDQENFQGRYVLRHPGRFRGYMPRGEELLRRFAIAARD
jgi:hypothetical protein